MWRSTCLCVYICEPLSLSLPFSSRVGHHYFQVGVCSNIWMWLLFVSLFHCFSPGFLLFIFHCSLVSLSFAITECSLSFFLSFLFSHPLCLSNLSITHSSLNSSISRQLWSAPTLLQLPQSSMGMKVRQIAHCSKHLSITTQQPGTSYFLIWSTRCIWSKHMIRYSGIFREKLLYCRGVIHWGWGVIQL